MSEQLTDLSAAQNVWNLRSGRVKTSEMTCKGGNTRRATGPKELMTNTTA